MRKRNWRITWGQTAADELAAAVDYLAERNRPAARNLLNALDEQLGRVRQFPRSGREVPELQREHLREVFVSNYRIIYRVNDARAQLQVLAFIHSARLLPSEIAERE